MSTSYGSGQFIASEPHQVLYPHGGPSGRKGVLWFPGLNGAATHFAAEGENQRDLANALVAAGYTVASCEVEETWGNSAWRTRATALQDYGHDNWGFAGTKVHLLGISMGSICALNYAKYNPTLVQSICLILPLVDIQAFHSADRGGFAASVETAYGGAPADADNPADNTGTLDVIPHKLYYSTDDTLCVASEATTYAMAVGAETVSLGAVGHAFDDIDRPSVAAFFAANES